MKKLYTFLVLLLSLATFAQAPEGFNYQATVRNSAGTLITNKSVDFKFKIIKESPTGTVAYSETRTVTTDDLGSVSLTVGKGTPTTGTFSSVDWGSGSFYLGIELNTGAGYVAMGTTQLLSVPYALYAKAAGQSQSQERAIVIITGDITDQQAAAKIAAEVGPNTTIIYVVNTTNLTALNLSGIATLSNLRVTGNQKLASINLDGVKLSMGEFDISKNPALVTLSLPTLKDAYGELSVSDNAALTTISAPSAVTINYLNIDRNNALTNLSVPALTTVEDLDIDRNNALKNLSFPALTTANYIDMSNNASLTSVSFPVLKSCSDSMYISENPVLNSISMPSLVSTGNYLRFSNNALPSSQINALLKLFVSLPKPTGENSMQIMLDNQNPLAPATGQGLIDKQTLLDKGYYVNTDKDIRSLELTIKDGSAVVSGAQVNLYSDSSFENQVGSATSDASGKVKFNDLNAEQYFFYAQKDCKNNYWGVWYTNGTLTAETAHKMDIQITGTATVTVTNKSTTNMWAVLVNDTLIGYTEKATNASTPSTAQITVPAGTSTILMKELQPNFASYTDFTGVTKSFPINLTCGGTSTITVPVL